jgi:hypothetical protein
LVPAVQAELAAAAREPADTVAGDLVRNLRRDEGFPHGIITKALEAENIGGRGSSVPTL